MYVFIEYIILIVATLSSALSQKEIVLNRLSFWSIITKITLTYFRRAIESQNGKQMVKTYVDDVFEIFENTE